MLRQNCCHFTDNIFQCIFLNENIWFSLKISLKFVPNVWINIIQASVSAKSLSEPIMVYHGCIYVSLGCNELNFPNIFWKLGTYNPTTHTSRNSSSRCVWIIFVYTSITVTSSWLTGLIGCYYLCQVLNTNAVGVRSLDWGQWCATQPNISYNNSIKQTSFS